jgi:hypothetical protein
MYPMQCAMKRSDVVAVLDTGAQRSAAKYPAEILQHTQTSHSIQGAFGRPTSMKGILMGCHIMDMHGTPLTFVIPHESISDPLLSDSLISAGRLMEAGFGAIFRIAQNAVTDGINPATYPIHGGTFLTPEQPPRTIIIEYQDHPLLPVPTIWKPDERLLLFTFNPFSPLCCDPEALHCRHCAPRMTQHHHAPKLTNANSNSCVLAKNKLRFFTSPEVTATLVIPFATLRHR